MPAGVIHCPNCGAELRFAPRHAGRGQGSAPGCPYDALAYAPLRAAHDALYFGAWRGIDAAPTEVRRAYHGVGRHLASLREALAGQDLPAAERDLAKAVEAYQAADPAEESPDSLRFLDNALSFAHSVIDDLLHEKGLPTHRPMDFSEWYDRVDVPFRDEW